MAKGYPLAVALGLEAIWVRLPDAFDTLGVSPRLALATTEAGASPGDPTLALDFIGGKHSLLMGQASSILTDLFEALDREDDLAAAPPRATAAIDLAGTPTLAEYAKLLCQQSSNRVFWGFEAPTPGLDVAPYHNALGTQLTVEVGPGSKLTTTTFHAVRWLRCRIHTKPEIHGHSVQGRRLQHILVSKARHGGLRPWNTNGSLGTTPLPQHGVLVKCGEAPRRLLSGAVWQTHAWTPYSPQ